MSYTHAQFRVELAELKKAASYHDPAVVAAAASRARTLLGASGQMGSVVSGGRIELQRCLAACEAALSGFGTVAAEEEKVRKAEDDDKPPAPPAAPQDGQPQDGQQPDA